MNIIAFIGAIALAWLMTDTMRSIEAHGKARSAGIEPFGVRALGRHPDGVWLPIQLDDFGNVVCSLR